MQFCSNSNTEHQPENVFRGSVPVPNDALSAPQSVLINQVLAKNVELERMLAPTQDAGKVFIGEKRRDQPENNDPLVGSTSKDVPTSRALKVIFWSGIYPLE